MNQMIEKRNAVRSVFTVKERILMTPHYIRVKFAMSDEQMELFSNVRIGANNKIFIPQPETKRVIFPDEVNQGASTRRTYTTRHIDYIHREIWIDFVAHGDNGPASYWANRARTGSVLGIAMKTGNRPLFPDVNEYLFVGDHTALPVISVMLEQLPPGSRAKAIIEIFGREDELKLTSAANLDVEWIYNPDHREESRLAKLVRNTVLPAGNRFCFVAAEYGTAKELKKYFREELAWVQEEYSVVSYWKKGESEDQSSLKRQEERQA
jgi:NADPH-dependent ferric siderophore reductase